MRAVRGIKTEKRSESKASEDGVPRRRTKSEDNIVWVTRRLEEMNAEMGGGAPRRDVEPPSINRTKSEKNPGASSLRSSNKPEGRSVSKREGRKSIRFVSEDAMEPFQDEREPGAYIRPPAEEPGDRPMRRTRAKRPTISIAKSCQSVNVEWDTSDGEGPEVKRKTTKDDEAIVSAARRETAMAKVAELAAQAEAQREAQLQALRQRRGSRIKTTPCGSLSSIDGAKLKAMTDGCLTWPVIIFDWDDTLFPTWYLTDEVFPSVEKKYCELPETSEHYNKLQEHGNLIAEMLTSARRVAKVAIVTLARRPWVENCCNWYMPDSNLNDLIEELGIPVYYAREFVTEGMTRSANDEEGVDLFVVAKRNAMSRCLRDIRGRDFDWKDANVTSVGDSPVEHEACQEIMYCHGEEDNVCKSVKMMEDPSVDLLQMQMQILMAWLPALIRYSKDTSISFDSNPNLNEAVQSMLSVN